MCECVCVYIYIYIYTHIYMCPRLKIFIVESEFSNLADIRLIVESYVWGRGQNTLPRVKSDTVIITDVNTQGRCVMDDSPIQTG